VSKYQEAIARMQREARKARWGRGETSVFAPPRPAPASSTSVSLPILDPVPAAIARAGAIRNLSERMAPMAIVENPVRLLVSGCRPEDGASTVAAALAIDMSQRLGLRTLLVDANVRRPSLHRLLLGAGRRPPALMLDGSLQVRATDWPGLELITCCLDGEESRHQVLAQFEGLMDGCPAVVVDLGVARLDARMLPLARPADPILLVVRQGHTERSELATTAAALRAANRSVAGVVMNAATDPVAKPVRRLLGKWTSL